MTHLGTFAPTEMNNRELINEFTLYMLILEDRLRDFPLRAPSLLLDFTFDFQKNIIFLGHFHSLFLGIVYIGDIHFV